MTIKCFFASDETRHATSGHFKGGLIINAAFQPSLQISVNGRLKVELALTNLAAQPTIGPESHSPQTTLLKLFGQP
jgi:hypothetical protein